METNQSTRPVYSVPALKKEELSSLKTFNRVLMNVDMQSYLSTVLGSRKEQFVNNLLALVGNDTKLQGCVPNSLIYAGVKATSFNLPLDPNLGFAYVVPYNNTLRRKEKQLIRDPKGGEPIEQEVTVEVSVKEAQFQMGYKGFIQLAIRTGLFQTLNVTDIRAGELGRKNLITGEIEVKEIENREEQPIVGYLAYFALTNGFSKMLYMSVDEIKTHATNYSQTYGSKYESTRKASRWTVDFDMMAMKTVLKRLLSRYAPLSVDVLGVSALKEAIRVDQAVITSSGEPDYIDNSHNIDDQAPQPAAIEEQKEIMRSSGHTVEQMP